MVVAVPPRIIELVVSEGWIATLFDVVANKDEPPVPVESAPHVGTPPEILRT